MRESSLSLSVCVSHSTFHTSRRVLFVWCRDPHKKKQGNHSPFAWTWEPLQRSERRAFPTLAWEDRIYIYWYVWLVRCGKTRKREMKARRCGCCCWSWMLHTQTGAIDRNNTQNPHRRHAPLGGCAVQRLLQWCRASKQDGPSRIQARHGTNTAGAQA